MIGTIIFTIILGVIYTNIAPFIYRDVFGHYLRTRTICYVYQKDDCIYCEQDFETLIEKCNPWLMFFGMAKIKPNIYEYRFDGEQTEKIWNYLQETRSER